MITAEKVQVLFEVAQRAPASLAERIVCQQVAEQLMALIESRTPPEAPSDGDRAGE